MRRGRAQELFDRIKSRGETGLDELISSRTTEELYLDYKLSADGGVGPNALHRTDLKNYAKSISGFGNSAGGVIIWGIECSSKPGLGDIPTQKVQIENPERFKSWLEGLTSGCTLPLHPSVTHVVVKRPDSSSGFVITFVPESPYKPLRCICGDCDGYYIRAGSSFRQAPHEVLMGMFGRSPIPDLDLYWKIFPVAGHADEVLELQFAVCLRHHTPVLAQDLYLNAGIITDGPGCLPKIRVWDPKGWDVTALENAYMEVVSKQGFRLAPVAIRQVVNILIRLKPPFEQGLTYSVTWGCAGSPIHRHYVQISAEEIQSAVESYQSIPIKERDDSDFVINLLRLWEVSEIGDFVMDGRGRVDWDEFHVFALGRGLNLG